MIDKELLPEFAGFFANARKGRLCFPHCRACSRFHWYPMPLCPHCQSGDWHWQHVSGAGAIYSFTNVRHAFDPRLRDQVPYTVALVTFADAPGVRLITSIVGADASDLRIGDPVEPVLPAQDDAMNRVLFRPTSRNRSARP